MDEWMNEMAVSWQITKKVTAVSLSEFLLEVCHPVLWILALYCFLPVHERKMTFTSSCSSFEKLPLKLLKQRDNWTIDWAADNTSTFCRICVCVDRGWPCKDELLVQCFCLTVMVRLTQDQKTEMKAVKHPFNTYYSLCWYRVSFAFIKQLWKLIAKHIENFSYMKSIERL